MRWSTLVTGWGLLSPAAAILVADDSPCGTLCGNVLDSTTTDDIVCQEDGYTSGAGIVYQQCVACELSSDYHTEKNETDQQWLLYNLRYAVSYCLFGVPDNKQVINTPCLTSKACGPFRDAVEYKNLSSKPESYEYCDDWPVTDDLDFNGCTDCLRAGGNYFLANFFTVLQAGCEQKPEPGITVSIDGGVFSQDKVNITAPTPVATLDPDWLDQGPISLDAKVGIAAGGFALILAVIGFLIIWRGRRRRRAFLRGLETRPRGKGWPTPLNTSNDMRETPLSQKPFRSWDESPLSARSEKTFPRYVSPYASQYSSPVSATELKLAQWPVMAPSPQMYMQAPMFQQQNQSSPHIGVALGGDESSINTNSSKGKRKQEEEYEMTPVEHQQAGIGIYHPDIHQHAMYSTGEPSQMPGPPHGYFPDGLTYPNQPYGYYYEDEQRRGRSPSRH
ncbi:hypothetical protein FALBO_3218 [Fusarium albosuccineum]|uniref:Lpxtg-domain-containing protein n=1 Tax=Fusarium albosuccineum TaxID=1237068 RepID=A0A8H4LHS2_9HYPO|nr:hypothetical protein FALBO_3218 [Fusarium albosuccineum]